MCPVKLHISERREGYSKKLFIGKSMESGECRKEIIGFFSKENY